MRLLMLGELKLEGSLLTRPKPLVLLAYLSVGGSRDRRDLAELFFQGNQDPAQGLRVTLAHLNREAAGAVRSSEKRLWTELPSDVAELEKVVAEGHLEKALGLYRGPFLEGSDLSDFGEELEEWLYSQRERVAAQVREVMTHLAEQKAAKGHFTEAAELAEKAYLLRYAPEPETEMLSRFYTLLRAGEASTESVVKEAKGYGLELSLSVDGARTKLQSLTPTPQPLAVNPYVGLSAFQEENAPFFFGRERAATDIAQRCQSSPHVVTVIGNSGAGKSSLVFAGVLPTLRKENWLIMTLRPGRQPFEALSLALTDLLETHSEREHLLESQELAKDLQQHKLELTTIISRVLSKHSQRRFLIVVDQLEELFTITEGESEAAKFLEVLLNAVQQLQGQLSLIVTLRADFIGALLEYPPILTMLQETRYFLGPMTQDELRQAILEPAKKQGVSFEAGLVERILDDVAGQEGSLPLLEFALTQLWEKQENNTLTHQAYDAVGGVEEALANHADATFNALSEEEQTLAKKVFLQLVYPGTGQEDTRRIATREELEDAWEVVQKLASYPARLLVTGYSEIGEQTAEVSHEALIRRWGMLRAWMGDYRAFRTWQERLRQDVKLWSEQQQTEATLLRGYRLDEAAQRMTQYGDLLSSHERDFIGQSLALRERENAEREQQRQEQLESLEKLASEETSRRKAEQARVRLRTNALWLLTLLGCVAGVLAILSYTARNQAVAARNEATALLPKLLSSVALNTDEATPQRSLLLALEADRIATQNNDPKTSDVQRVLRQLVSETGGMALPHSARVSVTRFSSDGRYLATLGGDGSVRLWDMTTPTREATVTLEVTARAIRFSHDGQWFSASSDEGQVLFWNLAKLEAKPTLVLDTKTEVELLKLSPDGAWLVTSPKDQTLSLWQLNGYRGPRLQTTLTVFEDVLVDAAFSPDSRWLVTVSRDNIVRLWDTETWQLVQQFPIDASALVPFSVGFSDSGAWFAVVLNNDEAGQVLLWNLKAVNTFTPIPLSLETAVKSLAFQHEDQWLAVSGTDGLIQLYQLEATEKSGLPTMTLQGHTETVFDLAFSRDGRFLASASKDKTVRLWLLTPQTENAKAPLSLVLRGHEGNVLTATFSPDSRWLVTGSEDQTARLWDLSLPGPDLTVLPGHGDGERRTDISPDGTLLASGNMDGTVYLQNLSDTATSTALGKHDSWVESVAFSPQGNWLVSASDATNGGERTLELWNRSKQPYSPTPFPLTKDSKTIFDIAFSSDGKLLASAGEDKSAQLWNINDLSKPVSVFSGHDDIVTDVALSRDNKLLATASFDSFIRIWDINKSNEPIQTLEGHKDGVRTLAFSPDGELLATGGQDGIIKIWSTNNWEVAKTLVAGSRTWALAFSPDGQTLATANGDGTLGLWQRDTEGLELLQGHTKTNWSVSFSQDGKWIVTSSEDGTVRFWPASIESVRGLACQKAGRNLTKEEWQDMFGTFAYQATCPQFSESY